MQRLRSKRRASQVHQDKANAPAGKFKNRREKCARARPHTIASWSGPRSVRLAATSGAKGSTAFFSKSCCVRSFAVASIFTKTDTQTQTQRHTQTCACEHEITMPAPTTRNTHAPLLFDSPQRLLLPLSNATALHVACAHITKGIGISTGAEGNVAYDVVQPLVRLDKRKQLFGLPLLFVMAPASQPASPLQR